MEYKRKTILIILGVLLIAAISGAAVAIGLGLDETVAVSYGSVEYEQSDLTVKDWQLNGPGTNVDDVAVTIENTGEGERTADVSVYIMNGSTVESSGTQSVEWDDGETKTIDISIDRVKEHEFDSIDIRVEE